jgi:RimJ/RimL family protein N-acetyltransferase
MNSINDFVTYSRYLKPSNFTAAAYESVELELIVFSYSDYHLYASLLTNKLVMRFIGEPYNEALVKNSFERLISNQDPHLHYYKIFSRTLQQDIGIGMLQLDKLNTKTIEAGRMLLPDFHGQGLGTQLLLLLSKQAASQFGATTIKIRLHPKNIAAIMSARKLGFSIQEVQL